MYNTIAFIAPSSLMHFMKKKKPKSILFYKNCFIVPSDAIYNGATAATDDARARVNLNIINKFK